MSTKMTVSETYSIRCNMCGLGFQDDEDLVQCRVDENDNPVPNDANGEIVKGCTTCRTDQYLMDI